ncbi:MAG: tetratricopeptide repeat protein [Phycisphaerales bacterium]|nr:MAG: tetratricopeptide repeat protein [Phycisphaerales bacterium]
MKPATETQGTQDTLAAESATRWYRPALLIACAIALLVHALILRDYLAHNPAAQTPIGDGGVYWRMAERIAAGQLQDDRPFSAAPLYPYLLAAIRALGGGLVTVYVLQMFLHVLTAPLIAGIARRQFDERVGLSAAILFLCLGEPIFSSLRVLHGTLAILLVTVVWAQLLHVQANPTAGRCAVAGVLSGLLCLVYPPMQLFVLVAAVWVWLTAKGRSYAWACAGTFVGMALVAIAPATVHNYRACGEFIPISSHGGVAFRLGYGPEARGLYTPIPGFTSTSEEQPSDAAAYYRRETGREGTPAEIDRFFFRQGVDEIRRNPAAAVSLAFRKAYWFLTGRYYHDIFQMDFEARRGYGSELLLLLLPTAWLMLPAVVGLVAMLRHPVRNGPGWMFFAVPLIVVVAFWYSPRYRAPAIPFVVISCAWVLVAAARGRRPTWVVAATASLIGGVVLVGLNRATGFDHPETRASALEFNMGLVLLRQDRVSEAAESFQRVLDSDPNHAGALGKLAGLLAGQGALAEAEVLCQRALSVEANSAEALATLGSIYSETGRFDEADALLKRAIEAAPSYAEAYYNSGVNLLRQGLADEAVARFKECLERDPDYFEALNNLGNLSASAGRIEEAWEYYRRALAVNADSAQVHSNMAHLMMQTGKPEDAIRHYAEAVRLVPTNAQGHENLGLALLAAGRAREAVSHFGEAVRLAPGQPGPPLDLAWLLATHPDEAVRDGRRAVELAERGIALLDTEQPAALEILAAAQAEVGAFQEAVATATRAIELAEQRNLRAQAEAARRRLELYRSGRPYRE